MKVLLGEVCEEVLHNGISLFDKYFVGFVLLWAQLRRYCYIEGVLVFRCAVSSLESFENIEGIGLNCFGICYFSPLKQIDITIRNKRLDRPIVFSSKLCLSVRCLR